MTLLALTLPWWLGATAIDRWAVVVGANDGGPQQERLRYAESDAARMAGVLTELGEVPEAHTELLRQPRPGDVLAALERVEQALHARTPGPGTVLIFYYSGHAKAQALSLGGDELPLAVLRERLERVPVDVRVVLLDACQSGAYSRAKGATRAADFSYNSVDGLNVAGTAVLASSSASELSQESDEAGGSFFTHHLVGALRGAADEDDDGLVTLDEAYRYTHSRTLEDTIKTRVGGQHVSFDTSLRGQGALRLTTMPRQRRRVLLDAPLGGRVLLAHARTGTIMADVRKAAGQRFFVTLPACVYRASVRSDDRAYTCPVEVREEADTTLELARCARVKESIWTAKGGPPRMRFGFELGIGGAQSVQDAYDARLLQFGYERVSSALRFHLQGAFLWNALPFLAVFVEGMMLDQGSYERRLVIAGESITQRYAWGAFGFAAGLRGTLSLVNGRVNPYLHVGLGPAFARVALDDGTGSALPEIAVGWLLHPALGCNFLFHPRFGLFAQLDGYFSPILRNLMNESHQSGGVGATAGIRVGL